MAQRIIILKKRKWKFRQLGMLRGKKRLDFLAVLCNTFSILFLSEETFSTMRHWLNLLPCCWTLTLRTRAKPWKTALFSLNRSIMNNKSKSLSYCNRISKPRYSGGYRSTTSVTSKQTCCLMYILPARHIHTEVLMFTHCLLNQRLVRLHCQNCWHYSAI